MLAFFFVFNCAFAQPTTIVTTHCENFSTTPDNTLPNGWSAPLQANGYPKVLNHFLQLYSNTTQQTMVALPLLDESSLSSVRLRFLVTNLSSNTLFVVGMMSDPTDVLTFEPIDTLTPSHPQTLQHIIDLSQYSGVGRYVSFLQQSLSGTTSTTYISNISIERCHVSGVTSYSYSTTSVWLNWIPDEGTDNVEVQFGRVDAPQEQDSIIYGVTPPLLIEGLDVGTTYRYHIRPYCSGSSHYCSNETYTFTTLDNPISDGYCEDFESVDGNFTQPDGWTALHKYMAYPYVAPLNSVAPNGSATGRALVFHTSTIDSNLLSMPHCIDDITTLELLFDVKAVHNGTAPSGGAKLIVGLLPQPYNGSSFIPVDTIIPTAVTTRVKVNFSNIAGYAAGAPVAFLYKDNTDTYLYIDNLLLSSCALTDVQVSQRTMSSVRLSWGNSSGAWIKYKVSASSDDAVGSPQPWHKIYADGQSVVITDLLPATDYQFFLWGQCQDTTLMCQAIRIYSFTLADSLTLPYCNGSPFTFTPSNGSAPDFDFVFAPVSGTDISDIVMSFRLQAEPLGDEPLGIVPSGTQPLGTVVVGVYEDPRDTNSFFPFDTLSLSQLYRWEQFTIDFAANNGSTPSGSNAQYIALRFLASSDGTALNGSALSGCQFYIDDIYVGRCAVRNVRVRSTGNAVLVQWENVHNSDSVIVEYGPQGFRSQSDTAPHRITVQGNYNSLSLSANPNNSFDFYVAPLCCGNSYCSPSSVTLNPTIQLPYCNESPFILTPSLPYTLFPLPEEVSLNGKWMNFSVFSPDCDHLSLQVGVWPDTNDVTSFIPHHTIQNNLNNTLQEFEIQLAGFSGTDRQLAMRAVNSTGTQALYIDRLYLTEFQFPSNPTHIVHGVSSHEFNWPNTSDNAFYSVEIRSSDTSFVMMSDSCTLSLEDLHPSTEYEIYFNGDAFCKHLNFVTPDRPFFEAQFNYDVDVHDCQFFVNFTNTSYAYFSPTGAPVGGSTSLNDSCRVSFWSFGNGRDTSSFNATAVYSEPGTYIIQLVVAFDSLSHKDTVQVPITLSYPSQSPSIVGDTQFCFGDTIFLQASGTLNSQWFSDFPVGRLYDSVTPDGTAIYLLPLGAEPFEGGDQYVFLYLTDSNGCPDTIAHRLYIRPTYYNLTTDSVCSDMSFYSWNGTVITLDYFGTDTIDLLSTSAYGCDSISSLALTVDSATHGQLHVTVFENDLPYSYEGVSFSSDTSGAQFTLLNVRGCDSIVDFTLSVVYNVYGSEDSTVCDDMLPLQWNGLTFNDSGSQQRTYTASSGADSIVTYTLYVNQTYLVEEEISLCRNELPFTWYDSVFDENARSGYYEHNMLSAYGCDSTHAITLVIHDVYQVIDYIESCEPITWIDGETYSSRTFGPRVTLQTVHNCDSTVTLDFHKGAAERVFLTDSFCIGTTYSFMGQQLTEGGYYVDTLETMDHCDSIISLTLTCLKHPEVSIIIEPNCEYRAYMLRGQSNVDYLSWSTSNGNWNDEWGTSTDPSLWIIPRVPTNIILTADYLPDRICPASDSVLVTPLVVPEARITLNPESVNKERNHFIALDQSVNSVSRMWWIDENYYGGDVEILCYPDLNADSVVVTLVAMSEYCYDTVVRVVPIYRHSLYAPNIFTPQESNNQRFVIFSEGIVDYELYIYDRTGLLLFQSDDPNEEWDGKYKGKVCQQGSYVWMLRYTTTENPRQYQTEKGSVLLLR